MTAMLLPGNCGDSMNREVEAPRMQSRLQTTILNSRSQKEMVSELTED